MIGLFYLASLCACGHSREMHLHYRSTSRPEDCGACEECFRYRRWWLPHRKRLVWRRG